MNPTSFVTIIAAIAGLLEAFLLPVFGAIIDYTKHRQTCGRIVAFLIWAIQTIQISISGDTWFAMAVLQALVVALFEAHYLLAVSYLPDVSRYEVSHETYTRFNRYIFSFQYTGQTCFLILALVISYFLDFDSVQSARLGQSVSSIILIFCYTRAWTRLPPMPERRKLPADSNNLVFEGFRQNYKTFVSILNNPNKTLKWFFITIIVSEAGSTSLMPIAVSYLSRVLQYGTLDVALTFLLAVIFAIPGAVINSYLSNKYNVRTSLRIIFVFLFTVTLSAPFVLQPGRGEKLGYVWGLLWGFSIGWFYSGAQLFFTLCVPPKQEAELAGFFVYCTIVLQWVPSILYFVIVENGFKVQWGMASLCVFQLLSMFTINMVPQWDEVLQGSKTFLVAEARSDKKVDALPTDTKLVEETQESNLSA